MLTERMLSRHYSRADISKGQGIALWGDRLCQREIEYVNISSDDRCYTLHAEIRSSRTTEDPYQVEVFVDELQEAILSDYCTCPQHERAGTCKHVTAVLIDFMRRPDCYQGYDRGLSAVTSDSINEAMRLALVHRAHTSLLPQVWLGQEEPVEVIPVFARSKESWVLRLKLKRGDAVYVVKDISEFLDHVKHEDLFRYGKKLSFVHARSIFTSTSQALISLLEAAEQTRRQTILTYSRFYSTVSLGREMPLSAQEWANVFSLFEGSFIETYTDDKLAKLPVLMPIVEEDPPITMAVRELSGHSAQVEINPTLEVLAQGLQGDLWLTDFKQIYHASKELSTLAWFVKTVCAKHYDDLLISADDVPTFLQQVVNQVSGIIQVEIPESLSSIMPLEQSALFYFDRRDNMVICDVCMRYGDQEVSILVPPEEDLLEQVTRDLAYEQAISRLVERYCQLIPAVFDEFNEPITQGYYAVSEDDEDSLVNLLFAGMAQLAEVGEVYTTEAFDRLRLGGRPKISVGVSVASNLLNLSIDCDMIPAAEIAALLSSYRLRRRYHRLKSGAFIELTDENMRSAAEVVDELGLSAAQIKAGHVEMPAYRAFLVDSLMTDEEKDESYIRWISQFNAPSDELRDAPRGLQGVLRPYQLGGFRWLVSLAEAGFGGILADEMGLGKTLQAIAFLTDRYSEHASEEQKHTKENQGAFPKRGQKSLIICPSSLVYNWLAEWTRFAPEIRVEAVVGSSETRRAIRQRADVDVLITSYDLARRDAEAYAAHEYYCVILDEAQYIKNHATKIARAIKTIPASRRFALTGTPIENRLSELWSIFDFIMPGLFGSYTRFRDRYDKPILEGQTNVAERLRAATAPFIMRRCKKEVLKDLPEKMESVIRARLEGRQRDVYEAHEARIRQALTKVDNQAFDTGKLEVLAEITRLRQLCCDARLVYSDFVGPSAKLDAIVELVEQAIESGEKTIIFSQFTSFLELIAERLRERKVKYFEITGSTNAKERLRLVDEFNRNHIPVFLISLKAGGTGLNVVGASVVIHADPWWNVAAEMQATDRAHRIGQVRDVSVYKVIAQGTIEERIIGLQEAKTELTQGIIGEGTISLASLTREDLLDLLGN